MGKKSNQKLPKNLNQKIIDYAASDFQSDFMDLYLAANAKFYISGGSGLNALPSIFRTPIVCVNMVPPGYAISFRYSTLAIFKHYYSNKLERELSFREIFESSLCHALDSKDFEEANINLIENSAEEIFGVVKEMEMRVTNSFPIKSEDEELRNKFRNIFPSNKLDPVTGKKLHGEIRFNYGLDELKKKKEWLSS